MKLTMINPPKEHCKGLNAVAITAEAYNALIDTLRMAGGSKNNPDMNLKALASALILEAIGNIEWDASGMEIEIGGIEIGGSK